jgi:hypothetical protein
VLLAAREQDAQGRFLEKVGENRLIAPPPERHLGNAAARQRDDAVLTP